MAAQDQNIIAKFIASVSKVEAHEIKATLCSFLLVLILMAAYYILRPVRDAMASEWSDAEVATLWTINFFFSFAVIALYGVAIAKLSTKRLVPSVYSFFALTFIGFYIASTMIGNSPWIDQAFYIWVSVFSLFPVSVFWSFMADLFTKEQSKRLFGIITTGASIGAMVGPSIPLLFSDLGTYNLMLVASVVLLATLPLIFLLQTIKHTDLGNTGHSAAVSSMGGGSLDGFMLFLKNPFMIGIGLFLFLYTGIGSFVYLELKNLMADMSREQRTEIWAFMDLATNTLTIVAGLFVTSRLATGLGLGWTLALIPLIVMGGLLTVAMAPLLTVIVGLQIMRRGGNYAITRPAREMLFTYVDHDTRFKAKPVIDVVVYRGGDTFWGWAFTGLTQGLGLGMTGVAIVGAGIAAIWATVGLILGKKTESMNTQE
ncbi:NTP/NDP exchange transporter [Oceanicoccus sp. KOV_DT_Chl]|uniref:NTP/NDP exchange transporter n=1 Tax=Oceanicoccus sp. KOV_DT_Chl TaxID=1904639 RepID=UPI000C7B1AF9|nr:MFS transporter [Oceanicoccus sp. KOV_DT_Chl]